MGGAAKHSDRLCQLHPEPHQESGRRRGGGRLSRSESGEAAGRRGGGGGGGGEGAESRSLVNGQEVVYLNVSHRVAFRCCRQQVKATRSSSPRTRALRPPTGEFLSPRPDLLCFCWNLKTSCFQSRGRLLSSAGGQRSGGGACVEDSAESRLCVF